MIGKAPYKVLVVDDSPLITNLVSKMINSDPNLSVMGVARDPFEAVRLLKDEVPDVILLDIEMPRMDGLTFLRKIMGQHPIPVVIFSAVADKNSKNAIEALRLGAVDVIQKPANFSEKAFEEMKIMLTDMLEAAAFSKGRLYLLRASQGFDLKSNASDLKIAGNEVIVQSPDFLNGKIIFMGASTGGTQAIEYLISNLTPPVPPILITQHMPGVFTYSYAERLNQLSVLNVKEAENGESVEKNSVYLANGFFHMSVSKKGFQYLIHLDDSDLVNRHKPSVDVLFASAATQAGSKGIGILLTGMGNDGAKGLLEMRNAGANTIAQDEKSAVVWGMPGAAVKIGAALKVYSLQEILNSLNALKYSKKNWIH